MKVNFTLFKVCFQLNFSELAKKIKKKKGLVHARP